MGKYGFWRRSEYFGRNRTGDERENVNIAELDLEREQASGGRREGVER